MTINAGCRYYTTLKMSVVGISGVNVNLLPRLCTAWLVGDAGVASHAALSAGFGAIAWPPRRKAH